MEKMRMSDIVVYLFDCISETKEDLLAEQQRLVANEKEFILVGNKEDLANDEDLAAKFAGIEVLFISARDHTNVDLLKKELVEKVIKGSVDTENIIITNARHCEALQQVATSLTDIKKGLDEKIPGDLIALDIRRCLHYLGEITGEISNEDMLDYIFSKFCIGK